LADEFLVYENRGIGPPVPATAKGSGGGPEKAGIMPNKPPWHKEKSRDWRSRMGTAGGPKPS
jgi:hypothetical protein